MDVLLITAGLAAVGYAYTNYQRGSDVMVKVSEHLKPRSELIYGSNRVNEVNDHVKSLAAKKYSQFLATLPKPKPGKTEPLNAKDLNAKDLNVAYHPRDGSPVDPPTTDPQNTPMFRKFKPVPSDLPRIEAPFSRRAQPQPQPQPFFGGRVKQPGLENRNSQALLEKFTGTSSFSPSKETEAVINGKTEKTSVLDHVDQIRDRIWTKSGGDIAESPFPQTNPSGLGNLRFLPRSIDETRTANNRKESYEIHQVHQGVLGVKAGLAPNLAQKNVSNLTTVDALVGLSRQGPLAQE
ncbi:hypothetical protein HK102_009014, partial [Quaeritorhiza haematococci]